MSTLHFFHLSIGKRSPLTNTVPKTLDCDSGKCDSLAAYTEKGFHDGNVWGPFSFAATVLWF
jgi:hypothetical protein